MIFGRKRPRFAYSGTRKRKPLTTVQRWLLGVILVLAFSPLLGFVYTYTRAGGEARVQAATASTLNFQARLMNGSGSLVADGTYSVQFKLYTAVTGGTNEWTETQSVTVKNGYFNVYLGNVTPFPGSIDWSQEKWLTLNVNGDGEMTPRIKLTAVPYAFRAGQADSLTVTGGSVTGDDLFQKAPGSVQLISSSNAGLRFNQTGSGGLLQLQGNGLDVFTVSKAGNAVLSGGLELGSGLRVGNSASALAGTIRWSGTDFEGYNGTDWVSLTEGPAPSGPANTSASFVSGVQNQAANATNQLGLMVFTSNTAVSATNGTNNSFVAPASGSFRACTMNNNANITSGTAQVRWRVNGATVGAGACVMTNATSDRRLSASTLDPGVVTFNAGDVIAVAVQSTGLAPTTLEFTVYWTVEYNSSATIPSNAFVQSGNALGTTAVLGTTDAYGLNFITNGNTALSLSALGNATFMGDVSLSTGDLSVAGLVSAASFSGSGSGLTSLNASNISSGTMSDSRLSSNVVLLDGAQTFSEVTTFDKGLTLGDSTSTTAGTLRWSGTDFEGYDGVNWVSLTSGGNGASQSVTVAKTANEIVNNSNVLQDDDELYFSVGANETWAFRFVVQANSGTTPDLRFAVTAPSGATCRVGFIDPEGATSNGQYGCGVSTGVVPGNAAVDMYEITGTIQNGATPGVVHLQWAQFTANASNTTIYAGSYLVASSGDQAAPGLQFMQGGNSFGSDAVLGTTDNNALRVKTNNIEHLTILTNGNVGVGDTTPAALFTVGTNDALQIDSGGNILTMGGLALAGAISGATTGDTINGLIINSGSLSSVAGFSQASGDFSVTGSGAVTLGSGSNALTIDSSAFDVTSAGAVSGVTTLSLSGAISGATATNTINGLVVNSGSLSSITGFTQSSGNFAMSGSGTFGTGSGAVSLNGATSVSTNTNGANALTINGTTGTAADALRIAQTGNAGNMTMTNTGQTSGALISLTQSASAFTGTGLLFNFASGSGSFAAGNFLDFQVNGTSRFKIDNTGALQINSDSSVALQVRSASGALSFFTVNDTGNLVQVGSSTADATGILFVLDSKTGADPTAVNGGSYYNSTNNKSRCAENGVWTDCITNAILGETTLGAAGNTISVTLNRTVEYLHCRVDIKGRTATSVPWLRFNNNATGNAYNWTIYGITAATVIDAQDNSDSEMELASAGSTVPFSADVNITNFSDVRKAVDWTAVGAENVGTNMNRFSGGAVWNVTGSQITSVQFVASTGNFSAGSHAWCEGRDIR